MECPGSVLRRQVGSAAVGSERGGRNSGSQSGFEARFVVRQSTARKRGAGTHKIRSVRARDADKAPGPFVTGGDEACLQRRPFLREFRNGNSQLSAEFVRDRLAEQRLLVREEEIQPLTRHASGSSYLVHGCLAESITSEHPDRSFQQRFLASIGVGKGRGIYGHATILTSYTKIVNRIYNVYYVGRRMPWTGLGRDCRFAM